MDPMKKTEMIPFAWEVSHIQTITRETFRKTPQEFSVRWENSTWAETSRNGLDASKW